MPFRLGTDEGQAISSAGRAQAVSFRDSCRLSVGGLESGSGRSRVVVHSGVACLPVEYRYTWVMTRPAKMPITTITIRGSTMVKRGTVWGESWGFSSYN